MYILETKYGNDGYAFWFKMLELLCDTEEQIYDCRNAANWEFLVAKTRVDDQKATEILNTLASLEAIDVELWNDQRTIWVQNLVNNLSPLYSRRNEDLPKRPSVNVDRNSVQPSYCIQKLDSTAVSAAETPQSRVEKSRVEKSRDTLVNAPHFSAQKIADIWNEIIEKPKVAMLTESRKRKILDRLEAWGCQTEEEAEEQARRLFERIRASDFLSGKYGKWRATFDWTFANDKNYVKVLEGNYDNSESQKRKTSPLTNDKTLGVGEYYTEDGRRTYGTGRANIPLSAPPRPGERYSWNATGQNWIIQ